MRHLTMIALCAVIAQVHAFVQSEDLANHTSDAQDTMNSFVDKLVDRLADKLFGTSLKVRPLRNGNLPPASRDTLFQNHPTRSAKVWAEVDRRDALFNFLAATSGGLAAAAPASAASSGLSTRAGQLWTILTVSGGKTAPPEIKGSEQIMANKAHGTCSTAVQNKLRWDCDSSAADRIGCYNRNFAEFAGYFERTKFLSQEKGAGDGETPPVTFYDSVTGKPLFVAPQGRTWEDFVRESKVHGWPSFRDQEVVMQNVRVLDDGETVSVDGTHLGHNLPDGDGNRYCINLISVAGQKETKSGSVPV